MKFQKTLVIDPSAVKSFRGQPGQWVSVSGVRGRFLGVSKSGSAWFLWLKPHKGNLVKNMRKVLMNGF